MTHQPEKKGFDLFNKLSRREHAHLELGFFPKLYQANCLHYWSALLQIATGSLALTLSYLHLIQAGWPAVTMTFLGIASTIAGFMLLYYALKSRYHTVDSLVKDTIKRVVRDHN